jgi:hypothetical protein
MSALLGGLVGRFTFDDERAPGGAPVLDAAPTPQPVGA